MKTSPKPLLRLPPQEVRTPSGLTGSPSNSTLTLAPPSTLAPSCIDQGPPSLAAPETLLSPRVLATPMQITSPPHISPPDARPTTMIHSPVKASHGPSTVSPVPATTPPL
ncbi:UNVERIFIED_CONTAM: hypothetical protein Sradi_6864300 [Sesamum radiatum]|uniref:Uncharacterized protein n=1 Tax=Sesamum radiatum TaxID=300843 RepID=A0AAW2JK60_SESRA